jgi:hypothetical protein
VKSDARGEEEAMLMGRTGRVTYDEAMERLVAIARANGVVVTARDVEGDADLAADQSIASAAGHALAGSTNVVSSPSDTGWFPYAELRFTELR